LLNRSPSGVAGAELHTLLEILADLDDMDIQAFFRRLRGRPTASPPSDKRTVVDVNDLVISLRSAFEDDKAFARALDALRSKKSVTKQQLTQVFYQLFDRKRGVPSKATRAQILELIEDERHIVVRDEKMGKMLGRRIVPAE
jgi:hypothetical protein